MTQVMFDNNVVALLAKYGIDPASALADSEFTIAYTRDLKKEYNQALLHDGPSVKEKAIIENILRHGKLCGVP